MRILREKLTSKQKERLIVLGWRLQEEACDDVDSLINIECIVFDIQQLIYLPKKRRKKCR